MVKFCSAPWDTVQILPDGIAYSCACSDWNSQGPIGNLNTHTLSEIMNGASIKEFRSTILDGSFSRCNKVCHRLATLPDMDTVVHDENSTLLPTHLNIAIDAECNLKCPSCRSHKIFTGKVNAQKLKILKGLVTAYRDVKTPVRVQLDGSGDIFASKTYQEFLSTVDLPNCWSLEVITNGNLITKKKSTILKIKDQIGHVAVSLDAATEDSYKITRGGRFDLVLDGIKWLYEIGIKPSLSFVVQKENYREISQAYELAKDYHCSNITYHLLRRWPHMTDSWWQQNRIEDNTLVDQLVLQDQLKKLPTDQYHMPSITIDGNLSSLIN